jgi:hypothetical protein
VKPTRKPPRLPPPPLEANDRLVTGSITAGWAVALVVLLIVRGSLPPGDRWWIWTCACGLVLGLFGLWYVPRVKRSRQPGPADGGGARPGGPEGPAGIEGVQSAPRDSGSNTVSSTDTPGSSTKS